MAHNPVGWFELYVQDMNRAKAFYETVFQIKLENLDVPGIDMWAFPMVDQSKGISGALVNVSGVSSGGNSTVVYFSCEDCATEATRVKDAGGVIQREKMSIGNYGFVVLALDTENNLIGLHSNQ